MAILMWHCASMSAKVTTFPLRKWSFGLSALKVSLYTYWKTGINYREQVKMSWVKTFEQIRMKSADKEVNLHLSLCAVKFSLTTILYLNFVFLKETTFSHFLHFLELMLLFDTSYHISIFHCKRTNLCVYISHIIYFVNRWDTAFVQTKEMCSRIWFLLKSKVHTGTHRYTPVALLHTNATVQPAGLSSPAWAFSGSQTEGPNMRQRFLREPPPPPLADPSFLPSFFTMLSGPWLPPSIPTIAPTLAPHSTLAHAGRTSPCGSKHYGKYQWQGPLEAMKKSEQAGVVQSESCLTVNDKLATNYNGVHYATLI